MAGATVTVEEVRKAQRATGPATVLAIGTATPANCVYQADYPDYYFRITKSEHMTDLKEKFKRMCEYLSLSLSVSICRRRLHRSLSSTQQSRNLITHIVVSCFFFSSWVGRLGISLASSSFQVFHRARATHTVYTTDDQVNYSEYFYHLRVEDYGCLFVFY